MTAISNKYQGYAPFIVLFSLVLYSVGVGLFMAYLHGWESLSFLVAACVCSVLYIRFVLDIYEINEETHVFTIVCALIIVAVAVSARVGADSGVWAGVFTGAAAVVSMPSVAVFGEMAQKDSDQYAMYDWDDAVNSLTIPVVLFQTSMLSLHLMIV